MKKLMHILFLSCLKSSELIEKKLHFRLTLRERMQLKMHTMMCDACTMYQKQSYIIEKGIEQQYGRMLEVIEANDLKHRIKLKLQH
jgi:hypothetical protein